MKVPIYSAQGERKGDIELPKQFSEEVRPDLIKRAVLSEQSWFYQVHGTDPYAGMKTSAFTYKRRGKYRGSYNKGISRVPRIFRQKQGGGFSDARVTPNSRKGRRAHPPKSEKVTFKLINRKEREKAIRSAIAATADKELVEKRGHKVKEIKILPIIFEDSIEKISKTKDMLDLMKKIGLQDEIERAKIKKVRPGQGTTRGRKYKRKKSLLLIVSEEYPAMQNLPGVDIVPVEFLFASDLAPGTDIGRLTVWTKGAIEKLEKEGLFL